jgi:hypothetical protein
VIDRLIGLRQAGWVCLDTFAHGGKFLSALDLATDHVYQASERGELRDFALGRYD